MSLKAFCEVGPNGKSCSGAAEVTGVSGTITFEQPSEDEPTTITYEIQGLAPGITLTFSYFLAYDLFCIIQESMDSICKYQDYNNTLTKS